MCCQGLSAAAQDAQVLRWAAMEDDGRLDKALACHHAEVKKRVQDVQTTRQVLSIQNARPHTSLSQLFCSPKPFWQSVAESVPDLALDFWAAFLQVVANLLAWALYPAEQPLQLCMTISPAVTPSWLSGWHHSLLGQQ